MSRHPVPLAQRSAVLIVCIAGALVAACAGERDGVHQVPPGPSLPASPGGACPFKSNLADAERFALPLPDLCAQWPRTDFSRHTVPHNEVLRGCPVRDCIPALDAPGAVSIPAYGRGVARFAPLSAVTYDGRLPVAVVEANGEVRGYPLHILTLHEIVNDQLGGIPVLVAYCPLCGIALAYEREVDGRTLDFSVSGLLRNADLVMFDRQTESWWQQATGEAIVGTLAGEQLRPLSLRVLPFAAFAAAYPAALVQTEDTGWNLAYGVNPFPGYDDGPTFRGYFYGPTDDRLPALERVVGMDLNGIPAAVPFSTLRDAGLVILDGPVVVFWAPGTVSSLDELDIVASRDIGTAAAYVPLAGGVHLTFSLECTGVFVDDQTRSKWDITGTAIEGPLAGARLAVYPHALQYWFAWAAFHPDTALASGP